MPEPARAEEVLRAIVLGLSLIAVGVALYGSLGYARRWWRGRALWNLAAASLLLGSAGMVGLVGELVGRSTALPFTWRTVLYTVSLLLAIAGIVGMIVEPRPREGRR